MDKTPDEMCDILQEKVLQAKFPSMVVTMGGKGAVYADCNGVSGMCPARSVQVVDTTGAGDTFNAALAAAVGKGAALKEAAAFAMNAASLSIEHKDVMPGLPTLKDVKAHYRSVKVQKLF